MRSMKANTSSPPPCGPIVCHRCKKEGHLAWGCVAPNPSKGRASQETDGPWCSWLDTRGLDKGHVSWHFRPQCQWPDTGEHNWWSQPVFHGTAREDPSTVSHCHCHSQSPTGGYPRIVPACLGEAQLADPNLTEILNAKEAGTDNPLEHDKDRPWSWNDSSNFGTN